MTELALGLQPDVGAVSAVEIGERELAAVLFARKLTAEPAGTTDADYAKLTEIFNTQGALEVLMQTCNFAFMNRFTDGLRLPSEDEAVNIYHETYGTDWQRSKK